MLEERVDTPTTVTTGSHIDAPLDFVLEGCEPVQQRVAAFLSKEAACDEQRAYAALPRRAKLGFAPTLAANFPRLVRHAAPAEIPQLPSFHPSLSTEVMPTPMRSTASTASSSASLHTASDTTGADTASADMAGTNGAPGAGSFAGTYADEKRRLNKLVNDSRAASVHLKLKLPTAVVIGALTLDRPS